MGDRVAAHGMAPGKQTGKYSRHCKKLFDLPVKNKRHYTLKVPGRDQHLLSRTVHEIQVAPAHECIDDLVASDPTYMAELERQANADLLPPITTRIL